MTEEQAIAIADTFIHETLGPNPRLEGDRYTYLRLKVRQGANQEWRVVYQLVFPDHPGTVVDGPAVVIVDSITQEASFFE